MRKNRRKRHSLQEIKALISELESTDLSAAGLARREGVSTGAVYQWKRKVGQSPGTDEPIEVFLPGPAPVDPFSSPASPASRSGLTLVLGNGIDCKIDPGFDDETLLRVIATVNQARQPC